MAIIAPADLPSILKLRSEPMKKYVLTKLGHPVSEVELTEDQLECALRSTCDHIAQYFPREQRLAVFWTQPLQSTYPLPKDAWAVQDVQWEPLASRIDLVFGAESFLFNIANVSSAQGMLVDFHLLQAFRKFSSEILSSAGRWELINEGNSQATGDQLSAKDQLIRLYPTPKGAFPVIVLYIPVVDHFRTPQARMICYDMLLAEAKIILGMARRKIAGMPSPDGGSINFDGADLVQEGEKDKENIIERAINLGEPMGIHVY